MDSTPLYVVIGSISGIAATVILIILHFPQVVRTIHSGLVWLYRWLRVRPMVLNRWRWWRQFRPSWRIVKCEDLHIRIDNNEYYLELQVDIECKNRNDRYEADYDSIAMVDIHHKGKGWEKQPYQLSYKTGPGPGTRTLQPAASERITHVFDNNISVKPLIENTAICKIIDEPSGFIERTPYMSLYGKLKREGSNKFKVKVIWNIEDDANRKNTVK